MIICLLVVGVSGSSGAMQVATPLYYASTNSDVQSVFSGLLRFTCGSFIRVLNGTGNVYAGAVFIVVEERVVMVVGETGVAGCWGVVVKGVGRGKVGVLVALVERVVVLAAMVVQGVWVVVVKGRVVVMGVEGCCRSQCRQNRFRSWRTGRLNSSRLSSR